VIFHSHISLPEGMSVKIIYFCRINLSPEMAMERKEKEEDI
jgi:hypothetical protein